MAKINFGNSNKVIREGINTDGWEFKPLKDYLGKELVVNGFFTTLGRFGEQAVIVSDGVLINMPVRAVTQLNVLREDYYDAIMAGKVKISNIHMQDFKNGTGVAYDFEIEE